MARILRYVHADAKFFECVRCFRQKSFAEDEGFTMCNSTITQDQDAKPKTIGKFKVLERVDFRPKRITEFRYVLHVKVRRKAR